MTWRCRATAPPCAAMPSASEITTRIVLSGSARFGPAAKASAEAIPCCSSGSQKLKASFESRSSNSGLNCWNQAQSSGVRAGSTCTTPPCVTLQAVNPTAAAEEAVPRVLALCVLCPGARRVL